MKIKILGCSGGIGAERRTTSILVGDHTLVDAGTGVCDLSLEELRKIRDIYVTHSHLDHVGGIPLLVDTIFDVLDTQLTIHALPETIDALEKHMFNNVLWPDFTNIPTRGDGVLCYHRMKLGEPCVVDDGQIQMLPVNHVIPAVGYLLQGTVKSLVYSGDSTSNDVFWNALNALDSLDYLVIESAFGEVDQEICKLAYHYCPSLLAADLVKLQHRPEVHITHLKPGAEDLIMQECRDAISDRTLHQLYSGATFEI